MYTVRETNPPLLIAEKYTVAHVADQTMFAKPKACLYYTLLPLPGGKGESLELFFLFMILLCIKVFLSLFFLLMQVAQQSHTIELQLCFAAWSAAGSTGNSEAVPGSTRKA